MKNVCLFDRRLAALAIGVGLIFGATEVQAQHCTSTSVADDGTGNAALVPSFLNAWIAKYPTSTLPSRMDALAGRDCNVCHHPPNLNTPGNCYRADISTLINLGMSIDDALNQLDTVDSDGDGVTNGEEALAARPEVGEIGYSPGLVGDLGTDPCGTNPGATVTGMSETPASAIPAVSEWGMVALAILMVTCASIVMRRRTSRA